MPKNCLKLNNMKKTTTDQTTYFDLGQIKIYLSILAFILFPIANQLSAQVDGNTRAWNNMRRVHGPHAYSGTGSGFSFYAAVYPMYEQYPGPRKFQSGLVSTWFGAYNPVETGIYTDIEGGLGWWGDTRFGTATPKFIMGGVANGFAQWANGVGAGSGPTIDGVRRDWSVPGGKYGNAQLSNSVLWPPDGLNMEQGAKGEFLGYGYRSLPITDYMPTTYGVNMSTGNHCWTLFLNTTNFKGPIAFIIPTFWTETALHDPSLEGIFLDQNPNAQNHLAIEFAQSPVKIAEDNGITYARTLPLTYPVSNDSTAYLARDFKSYFAVSSQWNAVENWFNGGQVAPTKFQHNEMEDVKFDMGPIRPDWHDMDIHIEGNGVKAQVETGMNGSAYTGTNGFAHMTMSSDSSAGGFLFDITKVKKKNGMFELPAYYKLDQKNDPNWQAIDESQVPAATGLQTNGPTGDPRPEISYLTPMEADCHHQDPNGPWNSPGPSAGPYTSYLGDGTKVTYYWYKFIDQPAMIYANLPAAMRLKIQARVEKMHKHWLSTDEYIPNLTGGKLVGLDAGQIVSPPAGMEIGYVPIVTRQELGVSTTDCNGELNGGAAVDNCSVCSGGNTGIVPNSSCKIDCNGDANGVAFLDGCNICVEGNTGKSKTINGVPAGYVFLGNEGETKSLPSQSDVVYGASCNFAYVFGVSGSVAINNGTFGDPAPGIVKKAYYKPVNQADCNGVAGGTAYLDSCNTCVGGTTGKTDCLAVVTSINDEATVSALNIYPNPVQNQVTIEGEFKHWTLTDSKGAFIKAGTEKVIDVGSLSPGLYYLNVDGEVMKFIKI
jgi:hypothetical protein